jgi:hypothetical protein
MLKKVSSQVNILLPIQNSSSIQFSSLFSSSVPVLDELTDESIVAKNWDAEDEVLSTLDNTLDTQRHVVSKWSQFVANQLLEILVADKLSCNLSIFVFSQVQDVPRGIELEISVEVYIY